VSDAAWGSVPTTRSARVRPLGANDAEAVSTFLHDRVDSKRSADEWRTLFEHRWDRDRSPVGYALVDGNEIVGFIGTIRSKRIINGVVEAFCNLTTWYVLPQYRGSGLLLLLQAIKHGDGTITNLTPTVDVEQICVRLGFRVLEERKVALLPLLNARSLAARGTVRVVRDREKLRGLLGERDRQVFDDHKDYACSHFVVVAETGYAYLVTKRRTKRHVPFSDVLYCSDIQVFMKHVERVKLAILRQDRTAALMIDRRFLHGHRPLGFNVARRTLFRSRELTAGDIDNLYSELVFLRN